jgi:hypothetical protein
MSTVVSGGRQAAAMTSQLSKPTSAMSSGTRSRTKEYGANYPKVSQAIWTAIQAAITGTSSVSSALQTAQGTISGVQQVRNG